MESRGFDTKGLSASFLSQRGVVAKPSVTITGYRDKTITLRFAIYDAATGRLARQYDGSKLDSERYKEGQVVLTFLPNPQRPFLPNPQRPGTYRVRAELLESPNAPNPINERLSEPFDVPSR